MSLLRLFKRGYQDVLNILYPRLCINCGRVLYPHEDLLCHHCLSSMTLTNFNPSDNPLYNRLAAIVPLQYATALFLFDQHGAVQNLIHRLKYQGRQDVGKLMADFTKNYFDEKSFHPAFDYIIPVPLHPEKQKKRGYNQMTVFGENLGNYFGVIYSETILLRHINTASQTKKTAAQRRQNVAGAFVIPNPEKYSGKHFLIIDDVITTGATIEACAETIIKQVPDAKVSVLAMAVVL